MCEYNSEENFVDDSLNQTGYEPQEQSGFSNEIITETDEPASEENGAVIYEEESGVYHVSFGAKEDMHPYDESINENITYRITDPLGVYTMTHAPFKDIQDSFVEKPQIDENLDPKDLQHACNVISDVLNFRHLPLIITEATPNAAFSPGLFRFTSVDDCLFINPNYAQACIDEIGSTDIVLCDLAHEIGHGVITRYCHVDGTYLNEKLADFVSGYVSCKLGLDVDAARKWFQWQYDGEGIHDYPPSEERWDIQAAGYYYGHLANTEDLMRAIKDPEFISMIEHYSHDNAEEQAAEAWARNATARNSEINGFQSLISKVTKIFNQ